MKQEVSQFGGRPAALTASLVKGSGLNFMLTQRKVCLARAESREPILMLLAKVQRRSQLVR